MRPPKKKYEVGILMTSRLATNMKPLIYQVQSACDYLKGGAHGCQDRRQSNTGTMSRRSGEVRDRIRKTVAFVERRGLTVSRRR
jgi:hypothetical protein